VRRAAVTAGLATALAAGGPALAQDWPQDVHFLIPGGAGGGWDGTARGVGEALTESGLIDNASFENMSGGGGGVAIAHLIETGDTQDATMMVNSTPIVIRSLQGVFPQNFRDLTMIASVIGDYAALVVADDSEFEDFTDVVEAYTADPSAVRVAGGSVRGGMDHLVAALAFQAAGEDPLGFQYVSYDAGGDALAGLLAGETQVLSTGLSEALSQARQGQVRIVGITAPERLDDAPDVPTLMEQGYDVDFVNWRGFFGAPQMSDERADELAAMLEAMYETEEWEDVRSRNGWTNIYNPRDEFLGFLEEQEEIVADMMRQLGVLE
jgi:putative tricarboxylic transport membrane protein